MASKLARFESSVGTPATLVYAAPVDNEGTSLSHCGCLSDYQHLPRHL
jgi:hypothetical protein